MGGQFYMIPANANLVGAGSRESHKGSYVP